MDVDDRDELLKRKKEKELSTAGTITGKKHQTYDSSSIAVLEGREAALILAQFLRVRLVGAGQPGDQHR